MNNIVRVLRELVDLFPFLVSHRNFDVGLLDERRAEKLLGRRRHSEAIG